jgi:predicted phage terminase large subunit-like protein
LPKENWAHLNLPAIAPGPERVQIGPRRFHSRAAGDLLHPEREPESVLKEAKVNLGSYFYEAQYQQTPVPEGGNLIKWDWFQFYDELPNRGPNDRIVQSWDTASKAGELNDYSVCTTWLVSKPDFYLIDIVREQLDYPSLKRRVVETRQRHNAHDVVIEDKGSGTSLIQDLKREGAVRPIAFMPEGDKLTRMSAQSAKIEAGQVHLPRQASWLGDFKTELMAFPRGRHDDQVDSLSQFLTWIEQRRSRRKRSGYLFHPSSSRQ